MPTSAPDAPRGPVRDGSREWFWVAVGMAAAALLGAAAILDMGGMLEVGASWWRLALTLPALVVLVVAWWQVGPRVRRPRLVLALWSGVLVTAPPLHSRDAYSYAAQGWLLARGQDPYMVPSGDAGQAGLLVGVHWYDTTSVYPPLSLELFRAISTLFDGHIWWSVLGMRIPNILAMVVLVLVLPKLARRYGVDERLVLWAGLLNPIVVVQWVGGIHNDAVMVAAIAVAFLVAADPAWRGYRGMLAGGAMIGVAMGIKQSAAVAGLGVVALAWHAVLPVLEARRRTWLALALRSVAAGAVAVVVFVVISVVTGLGFGWNHPTAGSPLGATSNAPISWVASFLRFHELMEPEAVISVFTTLCTLLIAVAMVFLVVRYGPRMPDEPGRPWLLAVGALVAFALLGPALQPWYLTWVLPFIAMARITRKSQHVWLVALCCASVIPALQDVMAPYYSMFVLAIPAWFLWRGLRRSNLEVLPATTV